MSDKQKILSVLDDLRGCYVAGGAITSLYTNQPINDFDVYPKTEKDMIEALQWLYENASCLDMSSRAFTFNRSGVQIQIMHFDTFKTPNHIFKSFDFTCCMGAFDLDDEKFKLHPQFLEHCSQRFLSFNRGTRFPYASAWRVQKYQDKGFTIGKIEFQKILLACAARPIRSWDDLKEQVGGVYGEAIVIPDGEEFSEAGMWKALETLTFKTPEGGPGSINEAILLVARKPVTCIKQGEVIWADFAGDQDFVRISSPPKNPIWKTVDDAIGRTFFKKVYVKDGRYYGPHYTSFEYVVGDVAVSEKGPGIFCYRSRKAAKDHASYSRTPQAVLELRVDDPSDIIFDHEIKLKKATVVAAYEIPNVPDNDADEIPF